MNLQALSSVSSSIIIAAILVKCKYYGYCIHLLLFILFMITNLQIGNYSVERVIKTVSNNSIAYEVTPKGNPNVKYTAEVTQMNTDITLRTLVEHIHKQGNDCMVVDMFGVRKAERQYLVTVKDSKRKFSKNAVGGNGNMKISASMSRRLILESVELVKGFHKMGIRMECPFEYFIQKEEG